MNDGQTLDPALKIDDLAFRFRKTWLFRGVNLSIRAGEFHVLMGENGVGKTTLLHCLMGLRKPAIGAVQFFGKAQSSWNRLDLYRQVGVVASAPEAYPWDLSVGGLLEESARFFPTWDHAFVDMTARDFQIKLDKRLRHLSSGEHAKVRLLKALAFRPKLLLLDELTANLSPRSSDVVTRAVIALMSDHGSSVLYVSHDSEEALRLSDHVHCLGPTGLNQQEGVA